MLNYRTIMLLVRAKTKEFSKIHNIPGKHKLYLHTINLCKWKLPRGVDIFTLKFPPVPW